MSDRRLNSRPGFIPRTVHRLSVFIIIGWVAIAAVTFFALPSLEQVGRDQSVSQVPEDAPSLQSMKRMGEVFEESESDSFAMIVLEGEQPLGLDAHSYYDELVRQLSADTGHVHHVQDFWGDPLTAPGAESADGKAAYVQVNLVGDQGEAKANRSVQAVRDIVERTPPPPGIKAYVTGPAPLVTDMNSAGDDSILKITIVTIAVILIMLLFVYRSIVTVLGVAIMVGVQVQVARGFVAFLGDHQVFELSIFAVNLLVSLGIAAGTDYAIFFFGRYHEARQAGEDPETAFYTTFRSVAKVVLASGTTIAAAIFCLSFARLPYFQTIGVPGALGMMVVVAVAVTLIPASIAAGSRFGLFEPKRMVAVRRWRRLGTAIVRWPAPILVAASVVALVGLLALPAYESSYNDRVYMPQDIPANVGFAAAERHFPQSRVMPDIVWIEADHDMRNPADFLTLHKLAKKVFAVPGVSRVQGITRPEGTPLERTSIPFIISLQSAGMVQMLPFMDRTMDLLLKQADAMADMQAQMQKMYALMKKTNELTHSMVGKMRGLEDSVGGVRDHLADFDDFFRPIRNYFYWEPHCFNIPICLSLRSIFETMDGTDKITAQLSILVELIEKVDQIMPQMIADFPQMIATIAKMRSSMLTMHSTMSGMLEQMEEGSANATAIGKVFDAAHNDDSFYLPPEVFENEDFKRAMGLFFSPDGKAMRLIISHRDDPGSPESLARVDAIKTAAEEALKVSPLENAKIHVAGTAATYKDMRDGSTYDLLIAGVAALCLVFIIMLIITRSFIAALVIVGTVALSLGAAFGLSVLIWQHILGIHLHWLVLAMSIIILLGVGSDYNLLLVSRMKEEVGAGLNTGIIRAMGGTGKVVTAAGLVFAFTMLSMVVSDLRIIGQVGSTIGLGLLFDTLVVRAFLTPSIAALLGRWFWWPQIVRPRPASGLLRSSGPRPLVRASLLREGP
ncbi:MMPL family RND transporter [Mycolicibacterium sp. GF69]|uniref:MMPL/RND family transporter n=1 Tax=Mycolicibacterium sp. GF69 TaxID=2267251 RepID=UPI000DCB9BC7|nr:RND family transporter [Mycolicibacterium sp. GF69]RAV13516.1 MMPL family RND transporter [Mycolicibacterium sp. GF69]